MLQRGKELHGVFYGAAGAAPLWVALARSGPDVRARSGTCVTGEQVRLAQQHEREGRLRQALELLGIAARAGDADAQFILGSRLLVGHDAPRLTLEGAQFLAMSAEAGHPDALLLSAVLAAAGCDRPQNWGAAFSLLELAARAGSASALRQLNLLGPFEKF